MEVVSWWMLDLARAAAGNKFMSLCITAEMLLKLYWCDSSKFSPAVTTVIITYLVAFSVTNMHGLAIGHLMQA